MVGPWVSLTTVKLHVAVAEQLAQIGDGDGDGVHAQRQRRRRRVAEQAGGGVIQVIGHRRAVQREDDGGGIDAGAQAIGEQRGDAGLRAPDVGVVGRSQGADGGRRGIHLQGEIGDGDVIEGNGHGQRLRQVAHGDGADAVGADSERRQAIRAIRRGGGGGGADADGGAGQRDAPGGDAAGDPAGLGDGQAERAGAAIGDGDVAGGAEIAGRRGGDGGRAGG